MIFFTSLQRTGGGLDIITDFSLDEGDTIDLSSLGGLDKNDIFLTYGYGLGLEGILISVDLDNSGFFEEVTGEVVGAEMEIVLEGFFDIGRLENFIDNHIIF